MRMRHRSSPTSIAGVFAAALTSSTITAQALPDDYFTPTIADLRARQQQLHARANSLNNAPLLTRAQREERAKSKRDRWPNVRTHPLLLSCDRFCFCVVQMNE
jgi:hypothetical protein